MASVQHEKRCVICDRAIPIQRCRMYPTVVLCGHALCHGEHQRRRHNRAAMRYQRRNREAERQGMRPGT